MASENLLASIRESEGFRSEPYWDVNAWRIGYGSSTITRPDGTVVIIGDNPNQRPNYSITRPEAELDLVRRVDTEFLPRAQRQIGASWNSMSADQQEQLVDLIYNYGTIPAPVVAAAQTGRMAAVGQAIYDLRTHNDGVNANRRIRNATPFGLPAGVTPPQVTGDASVSRPETNALANVAGPATATTGPRRATPAEINMLAGLPVAGAARSQNVLGAGVGARIGGATPAPVPQPPPAVQPTGGGVGGVLGGIANFLNERRPQ